MTGEVTLSGKLNFDTRAEYSLEIVAVDGGEPSLSGEIYPARGGVAGSQGLVASDGLDLIFISEPYSWLAFCPYETWVCGSGFCWNASLILSSLVGKKQTTKMHI